MASLMHDCTNPLTEQMLTFAKDTLTIDQWTENYLSKISFKNPIFHSNLPEVDGLYEMK